MEYDERSVAAIARELGVHFAVEPYQVRGAAVYAGVVASQSDSPVRLLLWPSLSRVDSHTGRVAIVLKSVERVDIYPGIEVTFRRRGGGYLFVTRSGQVNIAV